MLKKQAFYNQLQSEGEFPTSQTVGSGNPKDYVSVSYDIPCSRYSDTKFARYGGRDVTSLPPRAAKSKLSDSKACRQYIDFGVAYKDERIVTNGWLLGEGERRRRLSNSHGCLFVLVALFSRTLRLSRGRVRVVMVYW